MAHAHGRSHGHSHAPLDGRGGPGRASERRRMGWVLGITLVFMAAEVVGGILHVLGDLLGSVGAIVAGLVILATGWSAADPLVSVVIAALILFGAWRLVRESVDVLLEAAPPHVDVAGLVAELSGVPGLSEVHDVHVWTLTSGFVALSGHGVVDDPAGRTRILDEVRTRMEARGIGHGTFQLEMRALYQIPKREERP